MNVLLRPSIGLLVIGVCAALGGYLLTPVTVLHCVELLALTAFISILVMFTVAIKGDYAKPAYGPGFSTALIAVLMTMILFPILIIMIGVIGSIIAAFVASYAIIYAVSAGLMALTALCGMKIIPK
ncbi:MAG: hypothetical protein V1738_03370 [Patescibacteria group bacterium]